MFHEKRKLKGITEKVLRKSITTKRIGQLNDTIEKYGFNVWLFDDKILYKVNNEVKVCYD